MRVGVVETPLFLICHFTIINFISGVPDNFCQKATLKGNFNCENIYIWKSDQEDFISLLNVTFTKPGGSDLRALEGKTVRVIADNMKPYIISSNKSNELSGYLGDIWTIVQEALKFKSNITSVNYDTGLSIISKGNADVMLAAGVVKPGLVGVEYSQPYLYNWYHLYIKRPEARASSSSYVKTLNQDLWYASVLMFTILTISLWSTVKFLNSNFKLEPLVSLPSCFLTVCSGFLNQGFDLGLVSYTGRMLIFFSFIPGYMLYCAVNADLVAKLAIFTVVLPFTSIEDIRVHKKFALCLRSNSFVYNNFTEEIESNHTILPQWRNILNGPGCLDINNQSNLAEIICKNGVVILENRVVLATVVTNFQIPCDISNLNERYFSKGNSYLLKDGFRGTEPIETFIKLMKSTGILRRLEDKWIRREINSGRDSQPVQAPQVTFHHISGLIYLYVSLIFISLGVLGVEVIIHKYLNPNVVSKSTEPVIHPFVK